MFITKKKFDAALREAKCEAAKKWESKMYENEKRMWENQDRERIRDSYARRFDNLESRILAIEKAHNMAEDTPTCPMAVRPQF